MENLKFDDKHVPMIGKFACFEKRSAAGMLKQ